ncbi:MAG TPA: MarR family transcriptional regulator [Longimicrobium sp.]|nr:MarR family transcriptional regulator [Longimicrobium sp.]
MSDEIRRRRENRRKVLELLYACSEDEGESEFRDAYEMAAELGLSRQEAERIVRYLEDHGWVRRSGNHGLTVRITAQGIDHLEGGA